MSFYSYFYLLCFVGFDPQKNMYHTIAKDLFEFREMYDLPTALKKRLASLPSSEELSKLLMDKRAVFHKSCTGMYNKQKPEYKRKNYEKQSTETEGPSRKMTRLSTSLKNFLENCFFCEEFNPQQELHESLSKPTSNRVKAMAEDLDDLKLLGKLSEGDMVTTEAKYHHKCFLKLFNRHRKHIRDTTVESNDNQDNFIEGINKPYIFQT